MTNTTLKQQPVSKMCEQLVFWSTWCELQPLTAPKKNWLHCAFNENLFYIWNVVFKRKFVLQNRQLSLAANRCSAILNPLQNNENSYFDLVQNDTKSWKIFGLEYWRRIAERVYSLKRETLTILSKVSRKKIEKQYLRCNLSFC